LAAQPSLQQAEQSLSLQPEHESQVQPEINPHLPPHEQIELGWVLPGV
jgi:hypothetical protein